MTMILCFLDKDNAREKKQPEERRDSRQETKKDDVLISGCTFGCRSRALFLDWRKTATATELQNHHHYNVKIKTSETENNTFEVHSRLKISRNKAKTRAKRKS